MRTWIKICGTTSLEDALGSIEAGADALGFIFAPSKRRILPENAQKIIRELPPNIEKIGVFLDAGAMGIRQVVREVELTGIQMHGEGEFPPEVYSYLPEERRDTLRKIKTVIVWQGFELRFDSYAAVPGVIDAWLFDSGAGSGKTFDWHAARKQLGERQGKFIVAGGLTPENVGEAIRTFRPWGVDVVTGVEREPGRKDPERLKEFVAAVRRAEQA
ncbi:MAG TPA: phosphoribosylanthranilate isomerase [Candidatus Angelobacter sp.]|jgi:phosphoribosylanthranilate isomerase|nr:phosphoribosylanthranilate isomerase [Candidatus Angelobacter sp.]